MSVNGIGFNAVNSTAPIFKCDNARNCDDNFAIFENNYAVTNPLENSGPSQEETDWMNQRPEKPNTVKEHDKFIRENINAWKQENPMPKTGNAKDIIDWDKQYKAELQKVEQEFQENNPNYTKEASEYKDAMTDWAEQEPARQSSKTFVM